MPDCADKASMSLGWQLSQTFFSAHIHIAPPQKKECRKFNTMNTANSVLAYLRSLVVMHCDTTVNYLITSFFQRVPVLLTKCISLFKAFVSDVL